jgi:hypothetical protein
MSGSKSLHDAFSCPHAGEDWHDKAIKLIQEHENTSSKRVKDLILQDINDVLDEGLDEPYFWKPWSEDE